VTSILQPWVENLGLRHQGVLMSAMRGCDVAPRHDPSKLIQRLLRAAVLVPHTGKYGNPKTYITIEPVENYWWGTANDFLRNWGHYSKHYVMHFIRATEIIGYHGPDELPVVAYRWKDFYMKSVNVFHLQPETKEQLDTRLNADEDTFYAQQENR
jgi:hypothetical protein